MMTTYKILICTNPEHLVQGWDIPHQLQKGVTLDAVDRAIDVYSDAELDLLDWMKHNNAEIEIDYESSFEAWNRGRVFKMNELRANGYGNGVTCGIIAIESNDSLTPIPTCLMKIVMSMLTAMWCAVITTSIEHKESE